MQTLVEGGAWLGQRNTLGFTPREGLLNAKPMFTRGRLPKALRATLEYIEYAEVRELLARKHAAPASCAPLNIHCDVSSIDEVVRYIVACKI